MIKAYSHENIFNWKNPYIYIPLAFFTFLHFFWAAYFPLAHTETYYWDWSRHLHFGYYDNPMGVALFAWLGSHIFGISAFGIRSFAVLAHLGSILLLIQCCLIIQKIKDEPFTLLHFYTLVLLTNLIPVFGIQSFLLMPDIFLYLVISASLYFILNFFLIELKQAKFSPSNMLYFAVCSGLGFNIKYYILPIFISLVFSINLITKMKRKEKAIFTLSSLGIFLLLSLPTLIWNGVYNWISFRFQLNHVFGNFKFNIRDLIQYFADGILYITPLVYISSIAFVILVIINYVKKTHLYLENNYTLLLCLPFITTFFLFLLSACFVYVQPYWNACAFWLLCPLLATHVEFQKLPYFKINMWITAIIVLCIPTLLCASGIRNTIVGLSYGKIGYRLFFWNDSTVEKIQKSTQIDLSHSTSIDEILLNGCKPDDYVLASFNWTWTSRMAFYIPDHPQVLNLDLNRLSYYSFRDNLDKFIGCKVYILTTTGWIPPRSNNIIAVQEIKDATLPEFPNIPALLITGTIKPKNYEEIINEKIYKIKK